MANRVLRAAVFGAALLPALAAGARADGSDAWTSQVNAATQQERAGHLKAAEHLLLNALLTADSFNAADPRGAFTLDYLGTLYEQDGRQSDAVAVFERALKAFDRTLGPDSRDALASAGRLADAYEAQRRWARSEPLRRMLLREIQGQEDPDKVAMAQAESDLALCLDAQKKWGQAMPLYAAALKLREESLGSGSPEVAETLSNEGRVFLLEGRKAMAERLMRRALAIDTKALGPGDAVVADDLRRLAAVLKRSGKSAQAAADEAQASGIEAALDSAGPSPTPDGLPAPEPAAPVSGGGDATGSAP